jgi:predicted nucleic acid-binding protein
MSLYMESCCFIDLAKYQLGLKETIDDLAKKESHIQGCIKILDAASKGRVRVETANITISECQHLKGLVTPEIKRLFRSILSSGRIVHIITDSIFISERAQELRWTYDINLSGADAHHVASALEAGCEELVTYDKKIRSNAAKIAALGLRVTTGDQTRLLPPDPPPDKPKVSASELAKTGQNDLFGQIEVESETAESELEPSDEELPPEVTE